MHMFDFKTFAQMNLDCIFQGFDRLPALGEEVFAKSFTLQLGGGPMVCPIVLNQLGCKTELGTFLGEGDVTAICLRLLERKGFHAFRSFPSPKKDPVVVTAVFSGPGDRGFLAHNEQVYESCLPEDVVFDFLSDAKVTFAPVGHPNVAKRLHEAGVKIVFDNGWSDDLCIDKIKELLPYVDVYTPNDKEARKIAGTDDLQEALRFLARYTPNPVITMGQDGCAFLKDGKMQIIPAAPGVVAVDTTGAGDNFITGVVYGLIHDRPLEKCLRLGNVFAGKSITAVGCFGATVTREEISQYL